VANGMKTREWGDCRGRGRPSVLPFEASPPVPLSVTGEGERFTTDAANGSLRFSNTPRRRPPSPVTERGTGGEASEGRTPGLPPSSRLAFWLVLALLAAPVQAQTDPAEDTPEEFGPLVTAIEVRSDAPLDESLELENLIETEVGRPLTAERVRHTLRNLQATGSAAEIELYTRDDPARGGVVVVIVFHALVQVEAIRIEGELGLPREDLRRVIPQVEGEPLSEEKVLRGVYELKELYQRSGYFQATVRVAVETDEARRRAVVTYHVASGPRAVVSTIAFDRPTDPFPPAVLVRQLRLKPGAHYRRQTAREDAERLQDWLIDQKHGAARVDPPIEEYDSGTNSVKLTFPIEIGPRISIRVVGADERTLRRKGLLPFFGESGYDEALVLQAVNRLKSYFQEQGHYDVRIETDEKRGDGELVLTFRIEPGPVYTLREIDLAGNEEVSDSDLRQVMITAERALLRPGSGRLVQRELDEDVENLRRYYALHGYLEAEVGPPQVEKQGSELRLVIPIREGPRQRVVSLAFEGIENLDLGELRENLPLKEGEGFHPVLLESTLDAIRAEYAARGYTQAQVSARQDWNLDHNLVDLTIQVLEGPQQVADRIVVRGNERTEGEVIRRFLGLRQGDPISDVKLLEIERNLYRLGIFSRVDVELIRADLDTAERDVLVRVQEGKPRTLIYGIGWDSEDKVRGLFGFNHSNVGGKAYSLRTDVRWSQRNKRSRFIFNQPYLGKYPVSLTSTAFYEEEVRRQDQPYDVTRYGARSEAARVYGNRRVSLGLDHRTVELENVDLGVVSNEIERRNQPYQVTSLVPTFFWDRRDDPIATSRGWSTLVQLQYAFPAFETDTEFLKLFVQQTQFFDLGRQNVVAASLRFGGIEPFKSLQARPDDPLGDFPSRNVPIPERFVAGGDSTHRAYGLRELGIRGETLLPRASGRGFVPVGGDGLFLFNLEYRFPLFGDFGGTVFFDTGNVWADWRSIDFKDFKNGVGLGARYRSPLGPIRAGIGWKLDRERGEPSYELYVNIGNTF
jgi:outer membrane protein insertion porin family